MSNDQQLQRIEYLPTPSMSPIFRVVCALGDMFGRIGIGPISIDGSAMRRLLDKGTKLARKVEGEEWASEGDEIHRFWEKTLRVVNQSLFERDQHAVARMVISGALKYYLERRVQVYQYLLDNPHILDVKIERPLVIAGFPRTGSTLMHRLLAEDSNARAYKYWELTSPIPSPKPSDLKDSRIWKMGLIYKAIDFVVPGHTKSIEAFHMSSPTTIEEDTVLMWSMGLMNPLTFLHSDEPLRKEIFSATGRSGSYRFLRRCFQILNAKYPADLSLRIKSPFHSLYLEALFQEFPDAQLVTIHREPKDVLESWLSFMARMSVPTFREKSFTMVEFAESQIQFLERSGEVMASFLRGADNQGLVNHLALSFPQFVSNPVGAVEQVYDFFKMPSLTATDRESMKALLTKKETQKTLLPKFKISEIGISEEEIQQRFSSYSKVFGHLYSNK